MKPIKLKKSKFLLSIVIPVFNEEQTLFKLLTRVEKYAKKLPLTYELIVVDDGSTDQTKKLLTAYKSRVLKKITHLTNQGKGQALITGFSKTKGDLIIVQDADLEYHPKDYSKLLKPILSQKTEVVYGSRISNLPLNLATLSSITLPLHFVANKFLSFLTSMLYGQSISDMETGYKLMTRNALNALQLGSKGFEIEVEITAQLIRQGFVITEVPIKTKPRNYHQGKKIGFRDGLKAIYYLFVFRLKSRSGDKKE